MPSNSSLHRLTKTTPFPNFLLDDIMPTLKDTEWRVLCIVVRQTLGWQEKNGARRMCDWLTQRQLKQRTGRDSEALSKAIAALTAADLLEIRDAPDGIVLASSTARRGHRGKLYFGLHPSVIERLQTKSTMPLDSHLLKKRSPALRYPTPGRYQTEVSMVKTKIDQVIAISELRNPNTTKDSVKKESITKEQTNLFEQENGGLIFRDCERLLQTYRQLFHEFRNQSLQLAFTEDTSNRVINLLIDHSYEQLEKLLEVFFTCDIGYFERQGYSLDTFATSVHILQLLKSKERKDGDIHPKNK